MSTPDTHHKGDQIGGEGLSNWYEGTSASKPLSRKQIDWFKGIFARWEPSGRGLRPVDRDSWLVPAQRSGVGATFLFARANGSTGSVVRGNCPAIRFAGLRRLIP